MILKKVYLESMHVPTLIQYSQGTNDVKIRFEFTDITLKTGQKVYLYQKKPSGNIVYNEASDIQIDDGYVEFDITNQMSAEAGRSEMQLRLVRDVDGVDKILCSFPIVFDVIEGVFDEDAIVSSNEYLALDNAIKSATNWENTVEEIADQVNQKAQEVQTNANNASTSATSAATSATNAASSESIAVAKASEASVSASAANQSSISANSYALQAQSYAIGTGGVRDNESTDNAKKYYEQSKAIYESFEEAGTVTGVKGAAETTYRSGNVSLTPANLGAASSANPVFTGAISKGRASGSTVGTNSTALGNGCEASGENSVCLGYNNDGVCKATGRGAFATGGSTLASGQDSHAEGRYTKANGEISHAEGESAFANGVRSHAEGYDTLAFGNSSHSEGYSTTANGDYSHAAGRSTTALTNQYVIGHYNDTTLAKANVSTGTSSTGTAFVIGNGTSSTASNAFRVTSVGATYAKAAYNGTGADYAEFAEWADGNPDNEDRRGYFVTFDEDKTDMIRKANAGDYILGVVSGNPCVIGNSDEAWLGQYEFDEFGAPVYETTQQEESYIDEETGEEKTRIVEVTFYKMNPDYDPEKQYVHRKDRKEWDCIGWIGVLAARDDGSCIPGSYCKAADGGIATAAERGIDTYRVLSRVAENVIKIAVK